MKTFLVPVLASALTAGAPLAFGDTAAPAPAASSAPAAPAEKTPSADSLLNQAFSVAIDVQQTLAAVQDKESADKAVKKLQAIRKDTQRLMGLQEQLSDAEKEKMDALSEKMEERMDRLSKRCGEEGKRLLKARYYGSAALKDILKNSDEFSGLVEPDEDAAEPEEDDAPAPAGNVLSPNPEDLLPPH